MVKEDCTNRSVKLYNIIVVNFLLTTQLIAILHYTIIIRDVTVRWLTVYGMILAENRVIKCKPVNRPFFNII